MGRGLIILLVVSLSANVFLGGFVAGRYLGASKVEDVGPPDDRAPRFSRSVMGYARAARDLSPEAEAAFRDAYREKRGSFRRDRREMRRLRADLNDALRADTFDRDRASKALEAIAELDGQRRLAQQQFLLDAFEALSPQDRKAIIAARNSASERRLRERRLERKGRRPDERPDRRRGPRDQDGPPPPPPDQD
ncbi:MAG: periplasmic heavy metal sensor [Pseudomonadota bacterium]